MEELRYPMDNASILKRKKAIKRELLACKNDYIEKKIAILSGSTIGDFKNILEIFLLEVGIKPIFWEGEYNRFYEDAVFENEGLDKFAPDIVYIHTTNKNLDLLVSIGDSSDCIKEKLENNFLKFKDIWNHLKEKYNCIIIQNNFEYLQYRILGNSECYYPYGTVNFINQMNQLFYEYMNETSGIYINDINYLSAWYGLEKWHNSSHWHLYKYAFDIHAIPCASKSVADIIKSLYGKNKKAIAVDLDNTLWGGVIGDDGINKIKLGEEDPEGRPFTELQKYLKELTKLGVVLNICSKNDESNAKEGFKHPSSVLDLDDFQVIKANWDNKDLNIKEIASEINIGIDSIVFLDDNPMERNWVKSMLPGVEVLELSYPEDYVRVLDQGRFFEATQLSKEDFMRNEEYKNNKKRKSLEQSTTTYKEFLQNLKMTCVIKPIRANTVERVTQLINKTNQFNLTTRRYDAEEIRKIMNDNQFCTITGELSDIIGNNGLVTVIIGHRKEAILNIDLWVMSCRVFKRNLEYIMFEELVRRCKEEGIAKIVGNYIPTKKNEIVKDWYKNLGFKLIDSNEKGKVWEFTVLDEYTNQERVMEVYYE